MQPQAVNNESCRIFLKDVSGIAWQLFSLSQNNRDGSIYLGSPDFRNYEWLGLNLTESGPVSIKIQQDENGHISFHGLGQTHVKAESNAKRLVISGHYLLKPDLKEISLKRTFTVMPKFRLLISLVRGCPRSTHA